jgi:hypothetical protein
MQNSTTRKKNKMGSLIPVIMGLMALVISAGCSAFAPGPSLDSSIPEVLSSYSDDLSSSGMPHASMYSQEMKDLLQERKSFYTDLFPNALHSDLISISSTWDIRSISENPLHRNTFIVQAAELLEFKAKYRLEPDGHPIVRAAAWAIEHTDDQAVKHELMNLSAMHSTAASANATEGYDTAFVLEHTLVLVRKWNGFQIVEDSYTDANPQDNPDGTDVIKWQDGMFTRRQPDYSAYPDYSMYHTSIEVLGQSLLDDYSK